MINRSLIRGWLFLVVGMAGGGLGAGEPWLSFRDEIIDDGVQIGYGIALEDVDGDGKPDILLADKKQFVWYRNPDWQRFVMAENLTVHDNVCLAARDIDGDGKCEVAVGANWNPGDTVDSGSVHYLIAPEDRTQPWTPVQLHHEPTVHRMHWLKLAEDRHVLVVAPLHGRGNRNGEGEGVRLLAYDVPDDPRSEWKTTVIEDSMHMTHNLELAQWNPATVAEELLYLGKEGGMLLSHADGAWNKQKFERMEGGGEIRAVVLGPRTRLIATIEPMHGDKLVVYRSAFRGPNSLDDIAVLADRLVLDDSYSGGHAVAAADFAGVKREQIAAGWRLPNADGLVGIRLYRAVDEQASQWEWMWVDKNGMAAEDLRAKDMNGDGRPDIVAAGRATNNLKIYWNQGKAE
jgi:hypothetical protein